MRPQDERDTWARRRSEVAPWQRGQRMPQGCRRGGARGLPAAASETAASLRHLAAAFLRPPASKSQGCVCPARWPRGMSGIHRARGRPLTCRSTRDIPAGARAIADSRPPAHTRRPILDATGRFRVAPAHSHWLRAAPAHASCAEACPIAPPGPVEVGGEATRVTPWWLWKVALEWSTPITRREKLIPPIGQLELLALSADALSPASLLL